MSGFEGSYGGHAGRISDQAVMECKICWSVYDPALGDATRQIDGGTPFTQLPEDWSCPTCSAEPHQFMVLRDPGAEIHFLTARLREATERLTTDFTEVWHGKMRDVPLVNKALKVEAVGFRAHEGQFLGVLISPWFMNLVLLPDGQDWSGLVAGAKETIDFPSGAYEFIHNTREMTGGYKACSLFSPMGQFTRQQDAVDVAHAVLSAIFDPANRAETDRRADIRVQREAQLATAAAAEAEDDTPAETLVPSRRAVITAGLAVEDR